MAETVASAQDRQVGTLASRMAERTSTEVAAVAVAKKEMTSGMTDKHQV
jgi:hypothetical protein